MPSLKSDNIKKLYCTMVEVAKQISTNKSSIRFWCNKFSIEVELDQRGRKSFRNRDIVKLRYIQFLLKLKGLTMIGAARELAVYGWPMESVLEEMISEFHQTYLRTRSLKKVS